MRNSMQSPTMKDAVMRAYTHRISDAHSYLKEVLLYVAEVLGILLVLELFWAGLSLVFIVNQFGQETLAASELGVLLHQILVV
jgi:hypothetical protein